MAVMLFVSMIDLLFWGLVQAIAIAWVVNKQFPNAKLIGPLILWHSKQGLKWIDQIAKKFKAWWQAYADFGIILGFGVVGAWHVFRGQPKAKRILLSLASSLFLVAPALALLLQPGIELSSANTDIVAMVLLYFFGYSFGVLYLLGAEAFAVISEYFAGVPAIARVGPALPGVNVAGSPLQGIPLYGWLVFPLLLLVHEVSHGILTRVGKFRLKSTGLIFFGVLPFGAFIEPDEKHMAKGNVYSQLRVFAAGSAANYLLSFLCLVLLLVLSPVALSLNEQYSNYYDHPEILGVMPGTTAFGKLEPGMKILSINSIAVRSISDIHDTTKQIGANNLAVVETDKGVFSITLTQDALIGLNALQDTFIGLPLYLHAAQIFFGLLTLSVFFNFVVGVMNVLPAKPLDGGRMLECLLSKYVGKKRARRYTHTMSLLILALFVINLLPLFFPNY